MLQFGLTAPILAQVNAFLNWSQFLGIGLAGSGVALYALRSMRPKLARDHDIFFAAVALLCGGILFFQGWRQDPILQFGQFLLTGSAIFFAVESIRLRGISTEQAKRNTPIVDDERPVSRVYRAELDELNAYDDRPATRRIRGSRDAKPGREGLEDEVRSRRSARPTDDRPSSSRRPRRSVAEPDFPDEPMGRRSEPSGRSGNLPPRGDSRRRPRPPLDESPTRDRANRVEEPSPSEYVDYRPVEDDDNWDNY